MIMIDINPNILSKLQQDSNATKEIARLLKEELIKHNTKKWNEERIKIQKDLMQCLLPALLEIITKDEEILKYLDLSETSFTDIDVTDKNFKDSNANIDPQTVKGKTLYNTNLQNCNMAGKDFTGVDIQGANLENTNAQIDPQRIEEKALNNANLKGCTFINLSSLDSLKSEPADFTGVNICDANLENTNAQIDPQLIDGKSLHGTNVKGLDLSHADFTGVNIQRANLENTNAQIDPQLIDGKSLCDTNVKGLNLSHADFTGVLIVGTNLENTGAMINPHTVFCQTIKGTNLNYCTLIDNGKLEGIHYDKGTSFNHITFSIFDPFDPHNIYQDITEYIQTIDNPNITRNKVFNPNILSQLQQDLDAKKEIATLLKSKLIEYSKKRWKKERIKIEKDLLQCLLPALLEKIKADEEILKYLDLSEVSFDGIDITFKNFKDSNANIDPQTVKNKTLYRTNLQNCNMTGKDFTNVEIQCANLKKTGSIINPHTVHDKIISGTKLNHCTLIDNGKLKGIFYDETTSLEHVKFCRFDPHNIYQEIIEYIQTAGNPNSTQNKIFNPNILSQLQQDSDAKEEIAILLKGELVKYSKKIWKKERIKIEKELLQCLLPELLNIIKCNEEILKYLDLSEVSFDGIDVTWKNFKDSNANIDPQLIKGKSLDSTNVKGCTLINRSSPDSPADFTGVNIKNANLENTNAQIDPQLIKDKSLYRANIKGCTLINQSSPDSMKKEPADFTGIDIRVANLEDTGAQIDPQLIEEKCLYHTNLKGCILINRSSPDSPADFTNIDIEGANLERTGAIINPHTVRGQRIFGTNLNYCTLIDNGKLERIHYDKNTSLKHVNFSILNPHIESIYQDITEYIQKKCNPINTSQQKPNKVLKR